MGAKGCCWIRYFLSEPIIDCCFASFDLDRLKGIQGSQEATRIEKNVYLELSDQKSNPVLLPSVLSHLFLTQISKP